MGGSSSGARGLGNNPGVLALLRKGKWNALRPREPRQFDHSRPLPTADGASSCLEFLDRLTALIPPPRKYRHRYHGVFAPNRPLRPAAESGRAA